MVTLDLRDKRATPGLLDLGAPKAIRDLKAKKGLLGLMVCRVSQVYKDLQDPQGPQDAMGLMETRDILVFPGLMALMDIQVHLVCLDLRVNPRYHFIHCKGHQENQEGTASREIQVSLECKGHQGTQDLRALTGFLVVQGLREQRAKKA